MLHIRCHVINEKLVGGSSMSGVLSSNDLVIRSAVDISNEELWT